jgi:hypothetical protein
MEWEYAMYFVIRLQCNYFLLLLLLFKLNFSSDIIGKIETDVLEQMGHVLSSANRDFL